MKGLLIRKLEARGAAAIARIQKAITKGPVGIATQPQDVTEPHLFGMFFPFCGDVLAQGLKGRYDYLDGIILA